MEKKSGSLIFIYCVPTGREEWLVDLYVLCVPNGKEEWLVDISIVTLMEKKSVS